MAVVCRFIVLLISVEWQMYLHTAQVEGKTVRNLNIKKLFIVVLLNAYSLNPSDGKNVPYFV